MHFLENILFFSVLLPLVDTGGGLKNKYRDCAIKLWILPKCIASHALHLNFPVCIASCGQHFNFAYQLKWWSCLHWPQSWNTQAMKSPAAVQNFKHTRNFLLLLHIDTEHKQRQDKGSPSSSSWPSLQQAFWLAERRWHASSSCTPAPLPATQKIWHEHSLTQRVKHEQDLLNTASFPLSIT